MAYDLKPVKAPRLAGAALRVIARLAESGLGGKLLGASLLKSAGLPMMREAFTDDAPWPLGDSRLVTSPAPLGATADLAPLERLDAGGPAGSFAFATARDFTRAYLEGRTTPEKVAEAVIEATLASEKAEPPQRAIIAQDPKDLRAQASASAARWREGRPLGPLDGVPVAVKDEVDQAPYPTTVGTSFLREASKADAVAVARLRAAGALLIGKANMHEIGIGVTGVNPHHGAARNPYDPYRATGGSSSGPASAVASGLCPIALGADGGGSVRIPAALCGITGLKPTFGRVSETGAAPLCWTLAHLGPLGATVRDVALAYGIIAGPEESDPNTSPQPVPSLDGITDGDLHGLRIGIFMPWFEDAEPDVVDACRAAVETLVARGAVIRQIEIPELHLLQTVHLVAIVSEMATAHERYRAAHGRDYGHDTRLSLALARMLSNRDYVHAQRLRTRLCRHFDVALEDVDVIATPTTACTAPLIRQDVLDTGESNLAQTTALMRFAQAANLTGLPAISAPAGYDRNGLPVGFQMMGRRWEEALLLRLARVVERSVARRAPRLLHSVLE
jgi:Asp-tRNA(Asn)/Glu-tRNA(Gln) amidotransferase A subunit family amidase